MSLNANASHGKVIKRANPSTIQDKFLVGYQGWFTCAGDGEPLDPGHHGWLHWFNYPIPDGGRPNTDLWPDVSDYSPEELYAAPGLTMASGEQAKLFSSRHPKTVQRHFHWMAQHAVDGAFLQRFAGQCENDDSMRNQRDEIGDRVREAAEKEGRVFAIMYDVSGVDPNKIQGVLEKDWVHLMRDKHVLESPSYLKEKGRPVISLWGFGFDNRNHNPSTIRAIISFFRNSTPGGAYIIAGAPAHWRTSESDADRNPEFLDIWLNEFDAISPWTIGRYGNEDEADKFAEEKIKGDVELLKKRAEEGKKKVDYMPVVLPGGSGFNLSEGEWGFNDIKRNGGKFLWKQIHNARRLGVRVMYGAMWDEYDEGTAFMPVVQTKRQVPVSDKFRFMALDEDGLDLPSDWYMRICGFAAEGLRSERMIHETFPSKELQDYWSTRPHYEDAIQEGSSGAVAGGSGGGEGQAYQEWVKAQKDEKDEPPPPPYSLEAFEAGPAQPAASSASQPERTASPGPIEPQGPPAPAVPSQSRPTPSQAPPPVNPLSRPLPPSSNTFTEAVPTTSPGASYHSVSIDHLADDFIRQSSLSSPPPVHPSRHSSQNSGYQQPYLPTGAYSPSAQIGPPVPGARPSSSSISTPGAEMHPYGTMPSVQSPPAPQTSPGPKPQSPGASGYFPNDPQPQPHHQYSSGSSSPGNIQQPQPHHEYSYGSSTSPQAQWPPADWTSSSSQSQPHSPPINSSHQYSAQTPSPGLQGHSPPPSIPPRPYGSTPPIPPNRPSGGFSPQPQDQQYRPGRPGFPLGANALDFAFSAVGSVAGDERRRQLESGVGKLTQTGSKLFHKFAK